METRTSIRFDLLVASLVGWMGAGLWLDGWAHHHVTSAQESPFTPWHAVLYSGFLATAGLLVGTTLRRRRAGVWPAVPPGYGGSLLGVALFAVGGVADTLWHLAFGIEVDIEALVSPTHLLLAAAGLLIASGPIRALHGCPPPSTWATSLPALVMIGFMTSLVQFFTEYANPLLFPLPGGSNLVAYLGEGPPRQISMPEPVAEALGMTALLWQAAIVAGSLILVLSKVRPPFGAVTLVTLIGIGASVAPHEEFQFLPITALAGLSGDLLLLMIRNHLDRVSSAILLPAVVPAVLTLLYLATLAMDSGLAWSVHLVTGAIVLSMGIGLLLGLLVHSASRGWTGADGSEPATGSSARKVGLIGAR